MLKYAVIGRNFIVDWFLDAAKEFPELKLRGVYSRSKAAALEYAKNKGAEKIYSSIDEICGDNEVDFVYIASPNICHEEQALRLLEGGKHVLCEKPATLSAEGLDKLLKAAGERVFMEGMVPIHMPAYKKICELITRLGEVRSIDFNFCSYSSRYDRFKSGIMTNTFDPTLGNGAFMDLGIYCVEMLISLFGMPEEITGSSVFLPHSIDAVDSVICRYSDKIAKINVSKISDGAVPSEIQGENGCLLIDKISRPNLLTLRLKGQAPEVCDMSSEHHDMSFEIKNFISQINGEKTEYYNEITYSSMKFCDIARPKLGITFKKS